MQKIVWLAATGLAGAVLAVAGVAAAGSAKSTYEVRAVMGARAEVPRPKAPAAAKGLFTATVSGSGAVRIVRWKLTFSGLSGRAGAAHLHRGKAGVAGGVLAPLCGPCRSGQTGRAKVSKDVADVLERGLAYVNVHTAKNPAGEIRGQLKLLGDDSAAGAGTGPATTPTTTVPDAGGGGVYGGY